jgi:hypothetical protein
MLPPVEIRTALKRTIEHYIGVSADEAVVAAARLLGFSRTGGELKKAVEKELNHAIMDGVFEQRNGKLYASPLELKRLP